MSNLTLLHLSDLHISSTGLSRTLSQSLIDIEEEFKTDSRIAILVTGDTIHRGDEKAVKYVKTYFEKLAEIVKDRIAAVYIVPGNHDKKRSPKEQWMIDGYRRVYSEIMDYGYSKKAAEDNPEIHYLTDKKDFFDRHLWDVHYNAYKESGYLECIDIIYDAFESKTGDPAVKEVLKQNRSIAKKTYGVHKLTIDGKSFCVISANTAWSCADDYDERHLLFGDFQCEDLVSETSELFPGVENAPFCTIMLAHHPLNFLMGKEQDKTFNRLVSINNYNSVDWYLCGHIHDRSVIGWSNTFHTMRTLSTGFGWPESGENALPNSGHFYSVYRLYFDLNSVSIAVRNMNRAYEFEDDSSTLLKGTERNQRPSRPLVHKTDEQLEIRIPLHVSEVPHKIVDLFPTKSFFDVRDSVLKDFATVSASLQVKLGNDMRNTLNGVVKDWLDTTAITYTEIGEKAGKLFRGINQGDKADFSDEDDFIAGLYESSKKNLTTEEEFKIWIVKDVYSPDLRSCLFYSVEHIANNSEEEPNIESCARYSLTKKLLENLFQDTKFQRECFTCFEAYLNTICQSLANIFCQKLKNEEDTGIARVHFRFIADKKKKKDMKLRMLNCFASKFEAADDAVREVTTSYLPRNTDAKHKDLLSSSLSSDCPSLVFSLNKSACNEPPNEEKWEDFITVLPEIANNMYEYGQKNTCPYLTFGVTISPHISSNLLYVLDYIGIDKFVGNWIKKGAAVFLRNKEIKDFCDYLATDRYTSSKGGSHA